MRLRQYANNDSTPKVPDKHRVWNNLAILACAALFLYHFFVIWTYAVDIPFWDEWVVFDQGALSRQLDVSWVLAQHNEHRMLTNKLLIWFLYHINGWDIASQQIINFLVYGALLLVVVKMARKIAPQMPLWATLSFAIFLLSPINHENHFMGFQSAFHFVVLFFLCAALLLFNTRNGDENKTQSWISIIVGSLCAIFSIYSLTSGLVSCAVLLLVFVAWKIGRARKSADKAREWQQLALVAFPVGGALLLWFSGWSAADSGIAKTSPFSPEFWMWFLNVLSAGFGFESYSAGFGLLCLGFVALPLMWPILKKQGKTPAFWMAFAVTAGTLLILMSVTLGRASTGIDKSKTPRYVEFVLVLIPIAVAAWHQTLQNYKWKAPVLAALWMFCFLAFLNDWTYFRYYADQYQEREAGAACVAKYYETGNPSGKDWRCRSIYPDVLNAKLERARELDVSFSRNRAR